MQVRLLITVLLSLISTLGLANNTSLQDSFPLTLKNDRLLQLGVSYRSAVMQELEIPTAELLVQPVPFFSVGLRHGQVRTRKLPELFAGERGQMTGYVLRLNFPDDDNLDFYLEFASMKGNLGFDANVFGLSRSVSDDRLQEATSLSGQVAFRQNQIKLGIRQHLGRHFFVDASAGVVLENFILEAEQVKNARSAIGYFFDFVNELPPNEWHQKAGLRFGLTVGVRI